ncbi:beta-galactosidase [Phyllobacterium sp. 628]|uniref:glycoside hydrolase family 2 protein n=1 Tax=Phyllobacterium sp. 628 TaxID=2718938 RepID=UPI0016624A71|nr:glycoside hydrolase family 2 TIM barrel-domain containing protein [Phyllobacterium sp. 628]QND52244.1 beta-galactosidase [Phyllobacterium sp. 628]
MGLTNRRRFLLQSASVMAGGVLTACKDDNKAPPSKSTFDTPGQTPGGTEPALPVVLPEVPVMEKSLYGMTELTGTWTFQDVAVIPGITGESLASASAPATMSKATVPGTVLTSLINNGAYPDPFYAHIVTDTIPDTLCHTSYWYRTELDTPVLKPGQRFWLRFDGVNYIGTIWLNGKSVGKIEGAFKHGYFDVTDIVAQSTGNKAYLAVRIDKLDYVEGVLKPDYNSGVTRGYRNGGPTGITLNNGPTFVCTSGWDWLPTIPDRDMGIWRPVAFFTTGALRVQDLRIQSVLSQDLSVAELTFDLMLDNRSPDDQIGLITGQIDTIEFQHQVQIPAGQSKVVTFTSNEIPQLKLLQPKLWWPNGSGDPYLYNVSLTVHAGGVVSDMRTLKIGVRRIEYTRTRNGAQELAITVNNLPILIMGGNWGLDEALKRIPRQRIFDQVRLHRDANLNLIRNWVGQSTGEDFYAACDEYGILVWNDFFYSSEGGSPQNVPRYLDNVRDTITHYRNHPSILLWCGGNEQKPPQELVDGVAKLVRELDPARVMLESSAGDPMYRGYSSGGPYHWRTPLYHFSDGRGQSAVPFRNEIGSYSIPTLEFVQSMLPESSWECPDDYWADRDINANGGNGGGSGYIQLTAGRYGPIANLADFIRKSQLANYECIRAIYESYVAAMIGPVSAEVPDPTTGVVMWMSNPAQPSFVWQMYSHDLEQHSSFFAVKHACEPVHIVMSARSLDLVLANHTATKLSGSVDIGIYELNGTMSSRTTQNFSDVAPASFKNLVNIGSKVDAAVSEVCFVSLKVSDSKGGMLCENFYWFQKNRKDADYTKLDTMEAASIAVSAKVAEKGKTMTTISARIENTGKSIALMVHLQLFDRTTKKRILPAFFSNNYLNLLPGASTQISIEVPHEEGKPLNTAAIRVDGWKLDRKLSDLDYSGEIPVIFNENAMATEQNPKTFALCG